VYGSNRGLPLFGERGWCALNSIIKWLLVLHVSSTSHEYVIYPKKKEERVEKKTQTT